MLKLFRQLRRKFIAENKLKNYLVYALGEIFLVVVGILIALAINNAQHSRSISVKEATYLEGLQKEFQTSKNKLDTLLVVNKTNYESAREILTIIADTLNKPDEEEISELVYNSLSNDIAFNPNNSLLNEMINSGSLRDLSNTELRKQLTNWLSSLDDIAKQEAELKLQRDHVLDLFRSNDYSLRTILDHTQVSQNQLGLSPEPSGKSNLSLYRSRAFENNLLMFILSGLSTEKAHYEPLMNDLEDILNLIDRELPES